MIITNTCQAYSLPEPVLSTSKMLAHVNLYSTPYAVDQYNHIPI